MNQTSTGSGRRNNTVYTLYIGKLQGYGRLRNHDDTRYGSWPGTAEPVPSGQVRCRQAPSLSHTVTKGQFMSTVTVYGSTGMVGSAITAEAASRGFTVTGVTRETRIM